MTFRAAAELAADPILMNPPEVIAPPFGVAGRTVLVALGPKAGKSTTGAGLIANATRAGITCGLLSLDEALADSLQRLVRFDADLARVYLDDTFDPAALGEELAVLGVRLLVLDHLGKLAERSPDFGAGSQGDPVLWGRLTAPFSGLAREQNLAVVLLDQARRSDGDWSGSVAKAGSVDVLAVLQPKDGGLVCTPRGRVPLPPFRVTLDAQGRPVFSAQDAHALAPKPPRSTAIAREHRLAVLALLRDAEPEGLRSAEWQRVVREETGLSKASFHRIRHDLLTEGLAAYASRLYHATPTGERILAREVAG